METKQRISDVSWVDNNFILAKSFEEGEFMMRTLTNLMHDRYGWKWKPNPLELLVVNTPSSSFQTTVNCDYGQLAFDSKDLVHALGGVLSNLHLNLRLIEHRFRQGEKAFYAHLHHFRGKAPVSLKLNAFATMPRNVALFLLPLAHWTPPLLMQAIRWERRLLRTAFRFRRKSEEGRMEFFRSTTRRMEKRMQYLNYKPIHQVILERLHTSLWREKDQARLAATIRQDRSLLVWGAMKDMPANKRRREGSYVHARTGADSTYEAPFQAAWGDIWRNELDHCVGANMWKKGQITFARKVCEEWKLPFIDCARKGLVSEVRSLPATEKYTLEDIHALPMPRRLERDRLWSCNAAKPQLEFIVDSAIVANVVNMEAHCDNLNYKPTFDRMMTNLAALYDAAFVHKAGYLATHEWRPREWNVTADRLCNIALDTQQDFSYEFVPDLAARVGEGAAVQVYSDGGLRGTLGASAFAVFLVDSVADHRIELASVDAIFIRDQESAFAMEVVAADRAITAIRDLRRQMH